MLGVTVGAPELIIVLVIVLLLFGAKKLPELARSLGRSARELRKGLAEEEAEEDVDDGSTNDSDS